MSEPSKVGPLYRLPEPSKGSHGLAGRLLPKQFRFVHFHYASANPSWQFSLLNMQYPVEDIRPNAWRKIEKCSYFLTYNMNKFFSSYVALLMLYFKPHLLATTSEVFI
jgi:hypothetical protein